MRLSNVLSPSIALAEEGFPVSSLTAHYWRDGVEKLLRGPHAQVRLWSSKDSDGRFCDMLYVFHPRISAVLLWLRCV